MSRAIVWTVANALFAAALFYGFQRGVEGARNVAMFWAWFAIIGSTVALSEEFSKQLRERGPSVPMWVDGAFDATVICFLAWHGAMWTAGFYLLHTIVLHGAYSQKDAPPTTPEPTQ